MGERKHVVVGKEPHIYGLARLFQICGDNVGKEFEVVHTLEEAYEIVGVRPEDFTECLPPRTSGRLSLLWLARNTKENCMPGQKSQGSMPTPTVETLATRPPVPPFTRETAIRKVRIIEDAWNSREPEKMALAYTADPRWRNRAEFVNGRQEIVEFLKRKWVIELEYRLIKELWAYEGNRIAVRFAYECHDDSGNWFRSYGNENWEFDENGLMSLRFACINDLPIKESERRYHWPLGRRPDEHPGLSDLGF
jgi:nuclear transport factor 2 (NTF2) superfamily protein